MTTEQRHDRRLVLAGVLALPCYLAAQVALVSLLGDLTLAAAIAALVTAAALLALPLTTPAAHAPARSHEPALLAKVLALAVAVWLLAQAGFAVLAGLLPTPSPAPVKGPLGVVVVVLLAPLAEEVICRHLLHRGLSGWIGRNASLLVTSAVFALAHVHPAIVFATFGLGLLAGTVFDLWGQSLTAAWLVHAAFNLAALLVPISLVEPVASPAPLVALLAGSTVLAAQLQRAFRPAWEGIPAELSAVRRFGGGLSTNTPPAALLGPRQLTRISLPAPAGGLVLPPPPAQVQHPPPIPRPTRTGPAAPPQALRHRPERSRA